TSGGGAVGGFAIQLAKMKGAKVITTASTNLDRIYKLGADHIIDYTTENIHERVMEITRGEGVEVVIDMISPKSAEENSQLLRYNGALVTIAGRLKENPFPGFSKAIVLVEIAIGGVYPAGDERSLRELGAAGKQMAEWIAEGKISAMITESMMFEKLP